MKKAIIAIVILGCLAPIFRATAAPAYGLERYQRNEAYLGGRLPVSASGTIPPLLSDTGVFEDTTAPNPIVPALSLIPYTVNAPLFSDSASKTRWLFVPKKTTIGFTTTNWTFPPGSVFVKHFDLETNTVSHQKMRLETRFVVVGADGNVFYFTYRWNTPTNGVLVPAAGATTNILITSSSGVTTQEWTFPSWDTCKMCHNKKSTANGTTGVLGVKTAQQNSSLAYPQLTGGTVTDNQLRTLNHLGLFSPALASDTYTATNGTLTLTTLPQMADLSNTTVSAEIRYRSYLDANCAHCHSARNRGDWDGRFNTPFGINSASVSPAANLGTYIECLLPPDKSDLYVRDSAAPDDNPMPPGRGQIHTDWTNFLGNWLVTAFNPTNAQSSVDLQKLTITFNSVPDATSSILAANYKLTLGTNNIVSTLSAGALTNRSVTFTVTPAMLAGTNYMLTAINVLDTNTPQNRVWPNILVKFDTAGARAMAPNDNFTNATPISGITVTTNGDNSAASEETGEPEHAGKPGGRSVWWVWTAPASGLVTIDTDGRTFDTLLGIYTGNSVSNLNEVASNDDPVDYPSEKYSEVSFNAIAGTNYYIAVDGYLDDWGAIELNLHQGPSQRPANDLFDDATVLSGSTGSIIATNNFATREGTDEPFITGDGGGASVWWQWTAPGNGVAIFDTHGSSFDTLLAVYTGADVAHLTPIVENDDDGPLPTSLVVFNAVFGQTYYITVDGFSGEVGNISLNYSLSLSRVAAPPIVMGCSIDAINNLTLIRVDGPAGAAIEVEASDDAVAWGTIAKTTLTGQSAYFSEPITTGATQRFYRVVQH